MSLRTFTMAVVLVVSMAGMPLAGATPGTDATIQESSQEATDVAPGERLAAVVSVQDAELEGDLDERAFGIAVAQAATEEAKADVVAEQVADVEKRLDELDERKTELAKQREAGEISQGKYEAEVATLAAEAETAKRLANATAEEADELPGELLEERGVNTEAIQTLKDEASEMNGQDVAQTARSIAGEDVGAPVGGSDHAEQSPPGADAADEREDDDDRAATIDRAETAVERAEEQIAQADQQVDPDDEEAAEDLETAQERLAAAHDALDNAREADDDKAASEYAEEALDHAEDALDYAEDALESAEERNQEDDEEREENDRTDDERPVDSNET